MAEKTDIALCHYAIGVILLVYNLTFYTIWNFVSKNHKDKRYRAVCINVMSLILAFIYSFSLGFYARSLPINIRMEYLDHSIFCAWRYTPVLLLFFISSVRLTKWGITVIKIHTLKKKQGQKFDQRS